MITNVSPQNSLFLIGLDRIQHTISVADNEVSTGLRITTASDSPDQIGNLLQLRANQLQNKQVQANLTLAQTNAQAADDALSSSIQLMDTATTLATQGASDTSTAASRASLARAGNGDSPSRWWPTVRRTFRVLSFLAATSPPRHNTFGTLPKRIRW